MIQRKQTLYLLISLIVCGLLFLFPVTNFEGSSGESWKLFLSGIRMTGSGQTVMESLPLLADFLLIVLLTVIAIFAFKRRSIQANLTIVNIVLLVIAYGLIAFYSIQGKNQLHAHPGHTDWITMPLLVMIGNYLAYRGIRHDIDLLKAQDRLR